MSEGKLDPTIIQTFEVKPAHLYVHEGEDTTNEEFRSARKMITENNIELDGPLAFGIQMARQEIINVEKEFGVEVKDARSMKVYILPETVFREVVKTLTKEDVGDTFAFHIQDLGGIVLQDEGGSVCFRASVVYHEFVHKFFDKHVQSYAKVKSPITHRMGKSYNYRRSGLSVEQIKRTGDLPTTEFRGDFLNELGNYLEQQRFMSLLIGRSEFHEEKELRNELLKKLRLTKPDDAWDVKARREDGGVSLLRLTQENIYPDENGELDLTRPIFYIQFATDLGKVCDPENNGKQFRDLLIRAKIDPSKQNDLRNLIDSKLEEGFYTKLKEAEYDTNDNFLDLLAQIQNVLYPNLKYSDLIIPEPPK